MINRSLAPTSIEMTPSFGLTKGPLFSPFSLLCGTARHSATMYLPWIDILVSFSSGKFQVKLRFLKINPNSSYALLKRIPKSK